MTNKVIQLPGVREVTYDDIVLGEEFRSLTTAERLALLDKLDAVSRVKEPVGKPVDLYAVGLTRGWCYGVVCGGIVAALIVWILIQIMGG